MSAIDAQGVEEMQDIVCEKLDGIRAGVTETGRGHAYRSEEAGNEIEDGKLRIHMEKLAPRELERTRQCGFRARQRVMDADVA